MAQEQRIRPEEIARVVVRPLGSVLPLGFLIGVACARFVLNGAYELTGSKTVEHVSGYVGLVLAAVAGYGGLAFLLEDVRQETVLPLFRRGASKESIEGDLNDQLRGLAQEAGVRQAL